MTTTATYPTPTVTGIDTSTRLPGMFRRFARESAYLLIGFPIALVAFVVVVTGLSVGHANGDEGIREALAVLAAVPPRFGPGVGRITRLIPSAGTITVVVGKRIRLKLGDTSQLALKLEVVQRVMRRIQGAQRSELAYIDVSAPTRPAYGMRSPPTSSTG